VTRDEIARLIDACRVPDEVREQKYGPWEIRRFAVPTDLSTFTDAAIRMLMLEAGLAGYKHYTALLRSTLATLHRNMGETVMEDSPRELRKHLPILMNARGRVLISGLGLGCVVRGLLSRPEVTRIDVIEIDPIVIDMIWPEFMMKGKCHLYIGDALTYDWAAEPLEHGDHHWDFGWHDVWSETESLAVIHMKLMERYDTMIDRQGAWEFPRECKRIVKGMRPTYLGGAR
jgi:hypothetical protein